MPEERLSKAIFSYHPSGSSDIGRPQKCCTEAGTGLNSILERQKKNVCFNIQIPIA
jgi:hypothetical protein